MLTKIISRKTRPDTITLYNLVSSSDGTATYQRTVIKMVSLDRGYKQRLSQRGIDTKDAAQLLIEMRDTEITANRSYIPPYQWRQSIPSVKAQHFTLQTKDDFFIAGEVADELPPATKKSLSEKYQSFSITEVSLVMGLTLPKIITVNAQ